MKRFLSLCCVLSLTIGVGVFAVQVTDALAGKARVEDCTNGRDDDRDGLTDCADPDCASNPACTCTPAPENCTDGIDNDCDNDVDCADSNCATDPACVTCTPSPENCTDGIDNDCDNDVDCADADCSSDPSCTTASNRSVVVMASNDLGMHCACPGAEYFLLLPPFNTLRAQVIERDVVGGGSPVVLSDHNDIRVEYNIVENTDASLKADEYYSTWIQQMPKYGFGPAIDPADGKIQGLTGSKLDGEMHAQAEGWWEIVGVPAFPDVSSNSSSGQKIMTDPLGGPNRNPYLTGNVKVFDQATNALLAETNTTVPVAFGGCCECHLQVTADHGLAGTPANSFNLMGQMHANNSSGINFALIDPDGDGTMGPIRCSVCHFDAAMGAGSDPGYPGYAKSTKTFSYVLHGWHVQNPNVLAYNPNLAMDCYACHPGNNVDCYRGHHTNKSGSGPSGELWCSDCHGDLNQRVAEHQMDDAWSVATLPKCSDCHRRTGETDDLGVFGGSFLNSRSHKGDKILCSTCHGEPHALNPSTLAKDNGQNIALQGDARAIGVCDVCHVGRSSTWGMPQH